MSGVNRAGHQVSARARHLAAAGLTVLAMAREDLPWLTVQAGRRLPAGVRARLGELLTRSSGSSPWAVWGELLLDQPERARSRLSAHPSSGRLASALSVHAGIAPVVGAPVTDRARWHWLTGDLGSLQGLLKEPGVPRRVREKITGDLEALAPSPRPVPTAYRDWDLEPNDSRATPRVVHVLTNSLPWTRSGYTLRTHAILTAQREAGMAVIGVTRPGYPVSIGRLGAGDVDVVDGVEYRRCVPLRLPAGEAQRVDRWTEHLIQVASDVHATHLHSTTHYPNALAAQAAARALDLPWIHEVRGQLERTWASGRRRQGDPDPESTERFVAWREQEARVAGAADQVITLSESMKADLVRRGVSAQRITVVPNAIEASLLERQVRPPDARARIGLPEADLWVGAVSSVVHYEGLSGLVEAVALARAAGLNVRAAIVGDGLAWPELAARVRGHDLEEFVQLPGRMPREQALQWLEALDVVALPREDHLLTRTVPPLKLMEAMGLGRPVIASNLPVLAEIVRDQESGLLLPPGKSDDWVAALTLLAENPDLRAQLAGSGRLVAAGHTWSVMAERYGEVYAKATPALSLSQGKRV